MCYMEGSEISDDPLVTLTENILASLNQEISDHSGTIIRKDYWDLHKPSLFK